MTCQILLASDRGENAYQIARSLGCNPQTVRNAIHAFNERGLPETLQRGSKRPHTIHRAFDPEHAEALRELLRDHPGYFGPARGALGASQTVDHQPRS